jgi:trimeric autotransporter adhesin
MRNRFFPGVFLLAGLLIPLASCSNDPSLTSIVISPSTVSIELAADGSTQGHTQYTAIGYYTHPNHPAITKDLTDQVTWASSDTQVATISNTGLATVTGYVAGEAWIGNTEITASAPGFNGQIVSNAATLTVTAINPALNIKSRPTASASKVAAR